MKLIGIADTHFKTKDGIEIVGKNLYLTEQIDPKRGQGESAERIFLSEKKLSDLNFTPVIGMTIEVLFNRYGKVASLRVLDDNVMVE